MNESLLCELLQNGLLMILGANDRMLKLFKSNLGKYISLKELGKVAKIVDFPRGLRSLRQEGWDLEWKREKGTTWYRLNSLEKGPGIRREQIDKKTRYRILHRDNSKCQRCGRILEDNVKLTIDHKIPVDWGGTNDDTNLWTLCRECNEGKKSYYNEFDAEIMKKISWLPTATVRLMEFIKINYQKPISVTDLAIIAGSRDWTRQIRTFREQGYFEYVYDRKNKTYTFRPKS